MDLAQQAALIAVQGVPTLLSYGIGDKQPSIGDKVTVEVGSTKRAGWVIDLCSTADALSGFSVRDKEAKANTNQLTLLESVSRPKQKKLKPILES